MKYILCILVFFISLTLNSQNYNSFKQTDNIEKINFQLINNLIIIKLKINNIDSLNFILDSGMSNIIITELTNKDSIKFNNLKNYKINGFGLNTPLNVLLTNNNTILLNKNIISTNNDIFILTNDEFHLSKKLGIKINGIIGLFVFSNFIININYDIKQITLFNKNNFNKKLNKWNSNKIDIVNNKPYINTIVSIDSIKYKVKLLIDCGASHNLWLYQKNIKNTNFNNYNYIGAGLNGSIYGYYNIVDEFFINKYNIKNVIMCYPDTNYIKNYNSLILFDGSIGSNVLTKFNLIINYQDSILYLKQNNNFYKKDKIYFSKIEIDKLFYNYNFYIISNIEKNSNAEKSGLLIDDQIISINGHDVKYLELNEINNLLQSDKEKLVKIKIKRNLEILKFKFKLEKYVK